MKNKNRLMSLILSAVLLIPMLPVTARAADAEFTVEGGTENNDYTLSSNTLTIKTSEPLTISGGTADNPITGQIVIQSNTSANLTLNGVNLKGVDVSTGTTTAQSAVKLSNGSTLTLILAQGSKNTLAGGAGAGSTGAPAINVLGGGGQR